MRVTEASVYHQALSGIARSRSEYAAATEENSSGLKVEHAWDSPGDTGLLVQQGAQLVRQNAVATAAGRASDEAVFSDQALGSVNTTLQRMQELAVQMANDTYSATDRATAAPEALQLAKQLVTQGNARFGDTYVFGGYQTGKPAFDAAGNYQGDGNVRQVEIAPGITQPVAVTGDKVFRGAGGGTDLVTAANNFVTALNTNNLAGIQQAITDFTAGVAQVATARSQLGEAQNVFDAANSAASANADSATKAKSALSDADAFDSATRLAQAEQALQATITATAKQLQAPSLVDKL